MRPLRAATIAAGVPALGLASAAALYALSSAGARATGARWTGPERATLRSLSLAGLGPLPADPSNRYADDSAAAALGHRLFFDTRLSGNGKVACATCHLPDREFQDGVALAAGVGTTARRTMPVAGTAHGPWLFWDGRADSQWAQALGPLESAVEHGGSRTQYAHTIAARYRAEYEAVFGRLPRLEGLPRRAGPVADTAWRAAWARIPAVRQEEISRVYANVGKAIAAYERRIGFSPTRFDRYVEAELAGRPHTPASALSRDEEAGLRLFVGRASCVNCHNGPRLTDDHFHNTGVPLPATALPADSGRATGVRQALAGEFSCTSRYSDARPDDCAELRFAAAEGEELVRAYKTPSLRGVAERAPYMHAGQLASLDDVVAHYSSAPPAPFGHSELKPLRLSRGERRQLAAFLRTLSAPPAGPPAFLRAPAPPAPAASHGEPDAEPDEQDARRPLEQARRPPAAPEPRRRAARPEGDEEVHRRPRGVEEQAERQDLERGAPAGGVDELGEEGQEEERDLGVEHVRHHALAEDGPARRRGEHALGDARRAQEGAQPEVHQVRGPGESHGRVRDGHRGQQGGEPPGDERDVDERAGGDPERRRHAGRAALRRAPRRDVEHVGAGREVEREAGGEEEQQRVW